jgi:uncharacterized protein with HEPN domain
MSEKRDIKLYILDILQAIDEINEFVVNFSNGDELANNKIVYKAVLMNFIIMGEAARNLYEEVRANHPEVEWKDIMNMRNKLVHEYFGVDNRVVWDAINNNFPELKKILERIQDSLK